MFNTFVTLSEWVEMFILYKHEYNCEFLSRLIDRIKWRNIILILGVYASVEYYKGTKIILFVYRFKTFMTLNHLYTYLS